MKPKIALRSFCLIAAMVAGLALPASVSAGEVPIFNGMNFSNWHGRSTTNPAKFDSLDQAQKDKWNQEIQDHWKIENGEIVNDGKGAYLTTNQEFGDFEFSFEYRIVAGCDSGVYLRGVPQVQIWDPDAENNKKNGNEKGSGGLWNNDKTWPGKDPLVRADKPVGQWNSMRIRLIGERCDVWLNEQRVVNNARLQNYFARSEPLNARGPIQLQTHGAEIRWRNLKLVEYNADEANALLAKSEVESLSAGRSFEKLFNGKDLTGWAGATDNYVVADGSIQCLQGKGGVLLSAKTYENYIMRVDFQLPPGGNNGVLVRYPTKEEIEAMPKEKRSTDGAYVGMTELQVLDDGHAKYRTLDPRQAHGSAYGMAAAKRGYLRPVGQWNHEVITVQGSTIQVELNGTQILNADLSKVNEFMANSPHPGKDRTKGHVGFAGHSDPVKFRNVEVLSLTK
ncbi:MAG: DUF1080 domain-containing protein [Pirellula sp.]